jgi:hypothetical protein
VISVLCDEALTGEWESGPVILGLLVRALMILLGDIGGFSSSGSGSLA